MLTELIKSAGQANGISFPNLNIRAGHWNKLESYLNEPTGSPWYDLAKSKTWTILDQRISGLSEIPIDGDYNAFIETYASLPWIYVACWIIASTIASLPLRLYRGRGEDAELVEDGPEFDLLQNPNKFDDFSTLMEFTVLNLELTGNAYQEKGGIVNNLPVNLFGLESAQMTITPDPDEKIKGYVYKDLATGKPFPFEPEEIIHFKYANPKNQFYGQGAIKVLQITLVTELMREMYNKSFFENEARPDVILRQNPDSTKGIMPVNIDSMTKTAVDWRASFGGPKKTRLPVVLPPGLDVSLLTETTQDMHYREFEKSLRERIFGALGVPPALGGLYEFANYANSREQIRIYYTVTVPAKTKRIEGTYNRSLIRPSDQEMWSKYDLSDIPALEEDSGEKTIRLNSMLDRGIITRNEEREALNLGKSDDPNADKFIIMNSYIPLDDLFETGIDEPEGGVTDMLTEEPELEENNNGKK